MTRTGGSWAAAALLAALAGGCSTRTQVRNAAAEAGTLRSYAAPFEQVKTAALAALAGASLTLVEERWIDRSRWCALASTGVNLPVGRVARVVVEDHATDCRVWILVQSKPDVAEEAVAEEFQARISKALGLEPRPEGPPAPLAGEVEERYRSPIARCSELLLKSCRERGYRVVREDVSDDELRTIAAENPSRRLFAALYRLSPELTRVVVEVRGGAPDENVDDASAVQEDLRKVLQTER